MKIKLFFMIVVALLIVGGICFLYISNNEDQYSNSEVEELIKIMQEKDVDINELIQTLKEDNIAIHSLFDLSSDLSFASPEESICYFMQQLKENNLYGALHACSIFKLSKEFDFFGYINWMKIIYPNMYYVPNNGTMFREMNEISRINDISFQIRYLLYSITTDFDFSKSTIIKSEDQITDFINNVDSKRIEDISIKYIFELTFDGDKDSKDLNAKKTKEAAKIYGYDDKIEFLVLFDFEDKTYSIGMTLNKDKNGYGIDGMYANMSGTNLGCAEEVNQDFIDSLINDNNYRLINIDSVVIKDKILPEQD